MKQRLRQCWTAGFLLAAFMGAGSIGAGVVAVANGRYKAVVDRRGSISIWRGGTPVVVRSFSSMFGPQPGGGHIYYVGTEKNLTAAKITEPATGFPELLVKNQGDHGVRAARRVVVAPDHVEWSHHFVMPRDLSGWIDTGFVLNPDLSVRGLIRYWTAPGTPAKTGKAGTGAGRLPYSTRFWKAEFRSKWGTVSIEFRRGPGRQGAGDLLNLAKHPTRPEPKVMILPLEQSVKKGAGPKADSSAVTIRFDPVPGGNYLPSDRNVLLNGSFEAWSNPDLPDGWRRLPYEEQETAGDLAPDSAAPPCGRRSLKWTGPPATLEQILGRSGYRTAMPLTAPVTLSAFIRSRTGRVKLQLVCGPARKTVRAGKGWRRVQLVVRSGTNFPVRLNKLSPGTLWLDGVQLERGERATEFANRAISGLFAPPHVPNGLLENALNALENRRGPLAGPGPCRSVYTHEKRGRLVYQVRLPAAERAVAEVRVRIFGPGGRSVRQTLAGRPDAGGRVSIDIDLSRYPLGASRLRAELMVNGRKRAELEQSLQRLPPLRRGTEVKIDRLARVLLRNGKPFIPVGSDTTTTVARALEHIRAERANGFNVIHVWSGFADWSYSSPATMPVFHPERLQKILDAAQAADMAVILHLGHWLTINHAQRPYYINPAITDEQTLAAALAVVRFARRHPALLLWYLFDEPQPSACSPQYLEGVYRAVKHEDPYHPALVNFCGSAENIPAYLAATDLMAIDIYPVPQSPIGLIAPHARYMWESGGSRPLLWWIQAFGGIREPTAQEETCMTYQALVEGTRAILFYNYRPSSYAAWKGLGRLAAEIRALQPALSSPEGGDVRGRDKSGRIVAAYRRTANAWFVLAVNRSRTPVDAGLRLPPGAARAGASAAVLFEQRTVPLVRGEIHDHFRPLARHVYRVPAGR